MVDAVSPNAEAIGWAEQVLAGFPIPPEESWDDFTRLSMDQLFLQIWGRPNLSMRDKRLIVLGALGALGAPHKYVIHITAALRNGELTPEEAKEIPVMLMHYVGHPRASDLIAPTAQAIAEGGAGAADHG